MAFVPASSPPVEPADPTEEGGRRLWRWTVIWLLGAFALRTALSSLVPLLPDETYYWEWSRRLESGYFDHPPGIALLIWAGTALFGATELGVRAGPSAAALLTHGAAVAAAWVLAGRGLEGARAALRAAALMTLLPIATLGLVLATPDAALFATAMVALLAVERALAARFRSWASFGWWTLAGVALGGAFVAKYTAVLLPMGLVIACLIHPALRRRFAEPGPWWASAIALTLFAPVVVWNAFNDWASFRFQLGHGLGSGPARGTPLTRIAEMFGGQVGLASPILFVLLAIAVIAALREGWRTRAHAEVTDLAPRRFALAVVAITPLLFFTMSAWRKSVEANWPAMIYPAAVLLLATHTGAIVTGRWWRRGLALGALLLGVVAAQAWYPVLPLKPAKDPIARAHGWTTLAQAAQRALHDPWLDGTIDRWIAADRYQDASELAFLMPEHPPVMALNLGGRTNQYDIWPNAWTRIRPGDALVAVFDANPKGDSLAVRVGSWFKETRPGEEVVLRRGAGDITHRRIWLYRIAQDVPRDRAAALADMRSTPLPNAAGSAR